MTGHASRRASFATGRDCPCGRPIRWCCGLESGECCVCKVARLAAETARLVAEERAE
jgi:hypothetical protein